ncbi:ABC transporter ATP-binding protein [Clostridium botulinum]|uniref:Putative high-affinity branched chain amino acid ABC transporter, ATP-binding protein n=1 Tax=Clostridium botulinum (strain Langeland / NCTC 10281 / Type F) TaxID=441772 RepID=A7GAL8_CLOBL|nr:ABC transporter ATP-binding protein [Clostridium botulinum]ABS42592.1 putative high-affinity branched chain amino acid ABC transporter, ATP-binding protein [Clostridium botulinum F str. Langeland]ADF98292.1 putative high-affinity branched chain amino acid ABC transporter, ATP-binding protein [Clostridium botulinum F str. 230613]KKM40469.1 ABC transporter [Clostridium botulinum]MBY6793290.1 ABC transporter ATP-binding protein [Clostridium botulinum]MBY6939145.1 ABC transporter ATP-binding pr
MNILEVKDLNINFGGITAIDNLNFSVKKGEILGVIGPNGAGKTTLYNTITGIYKPSKGDIFLNNKKITGTKPYKISRLGIARTFQNIRLFNSLTVLENILVGRVSELKKLVKLNPYMKEIFDILEVVGLEKVINNMASDLPYGQQRKVEIARALALSPKVLLLDEPAAGMNNYEKQDLKNLINILREDFNITVLIIEHDMGVIMDLCDRILVLDYGKKIAEGSPEEISNDANVIKAYMGKVIKEI